MYRSALISLSDLDDVEMRGAKSGQWWDTAPWRYIANNSAVHESRPSRARFDAEWAALVASGTGERGIFSRGAAAAQAARHRGRRTAGVAFGTNPCSEIILRPQQFCNLSEVRWCAVVRWIPEFVCVLECGVCKRTAAGGVVDPFSVENFLDMWCVMHPEMPVATRCHAWLDL
jgi:hypothetical protein